MTYFLSQAAFKVDELKRHEVDMNTHESANRSTESSFERQVVVEPWVMGKSGQPKREQ